MGTELNFCCNAFWSPRVFYHSLFLAVGGNPETAQSKLLFSACFWFSKEQELLIHKRFKKKIVCKWKYFPNFLLCNFSEVLNIVAKFKMLHTASTAGKSRSCSLKSPFLSLAKYENLIWEICSLSQSIINSPVLKVIFHSLVSSALVLPPINELVNDKNQAVSWCRISETMQIDTLWIPCPEFMIGSWNWMYLL